MFDCKAFDGEALVHFLPTTMTSNFREYSEDVFLPFLKRELRGDTRRTDVVWNQYLKNGFKASTREKRRSVIHLKVSAQTILPSKWKGFLLDTSNKVELFAYLNEEVYRRD